MYMKPFERIAEIREEALERYNETLVEQFQPIVEVLVRELQVRYPKRNIYMLFGNGSCVVNFTNNSNYYSSYLDNYGNLEGWYSYNEKCVMTLRSFGEDHPLVQLMQVLDELYDVVDCCPPLEDIR